MSFNPIQKIIIAVSLVLIIVGVIFTIFNWPECSESMIIPMDGFVNTQRAQYWGIKTNKDYLAFGGASLGSTIKRSMMVQHKQKVSVDIRLSGDIAPFVTAEPAAFTIEEGKEQQVDFYFTPIEGTAQGNYRGEVIYCFKDR